MSASLLLSGVITLLLSVIIARALLAPFFREYSAVAASAATQNLNSEIESLYQQLERLDEEYEAEKIAEPAYQKERRRLMVQLSEILERKDRSKC